MRPRFAVGVTPVRRYAPTVICRSLLVALVVATASTGALALAASKSSDLVPGNGTVEGHGYGYWEAANWRWRDSLPDVTANKAVCLSARQSGPVWFLGGSAVKESAVTRTCHVPIGRYLMIDGPGVECSTVERAPYHATTDAGLKGCARSWWRKHHGGEDLRLDGVTIRKAGYLFATPVFAFTMPARNNWLGVSGRTGGHAAYYGAASILRPLSAGTHTLIRIASYTHPAYAVKTTYKLTVG